MEDALKRMAYKPNVKELDAKTTFAKRMRARLRYNSLTKTFHSIKSTAKGPTVIELGPYLNKYHLRTLFFGGCVLGLGFYSSVLVTMTRKETFKRNFALIEQKYGEKHRAAFG